MQRYADSATSEVTMYLTIAEAAARLRVSPDTIRRRIKSRELPAVLFAGKYRIEAADLDALIARSAA